MILPFSFPLLQQEKKTQHVSSVMIGTTEVIMKETGIIDIGSNTVVLKIYDENGKDTENGYYSSAIHLISHIKDGLMQESGIQAALQVLRQYRKILEERGVTEVYGLVTEPCRHISNRDAFLEALNSIGYEIRPLTGEEEASYDFLGSRLDTSDISSGTAFDIGGGSTEIVSFCDGTVIHALTSIPYGCLRLKDCPLERKIPLSIIQQETERMPALLDYAGDILIGGGGTCRAVLLMHEKWFGNRHVSETDLSMMFDALKSGNKDAVEVLNETVSEDRRDVILPGINMILAMMEVFHASELRCSSYGVREGYLLAHRQ